MRLPINFVLHVTWTGLLGLAGWTFYQTLPEGTGTAHTKSHEKGVEDARDRLNKGIGQIPSQTAWKYDSTTWMQRWMAANLVGKDPPKVSATDPTIEEKAPPQPIDRRPIKEIVELVTVMHEGSPEGEGALSHVVVRYREGIDVQPPLWYLRETAVVGAAANTPVDTTPPPPGIQPARPGRPRPGGQVPTVPRPVPTAPRPGTAMPTSTAGAKYLQRVWVAGDGAPRFEATLWPPFDNIRLVSVAPDAKSATFKRTHPAREGEPEPAPDIEEVWRSSEYLSPEVLQTLTAVQREEAARRAAQAANQPAAAASTSSWVEVDETRKIDNVFHVARKENPEELMTQVYADTYTSRSGGSLRGVVLRNVPSAVAARFGVVQGDVILAVNGESVRTKSEAINVGRRQYERGQRTFVVRFLSNGQEVERTYQAPDR